MTPEEIDEQARLLATTFIVRKDVKAVQHRGGAYTPEHEKWSMRDLRSHVEGTRSFGHYMLSQDSTCKLLAFDIDLEKSGRWLELADGEYSDEAILVHNDFNPREVWKPLDEPAGREGSASVYFTSVLLQTARLLASEVRSLLGIPAAIAYSGNKGLHVYGYTGEIPAAEAREAALMVLAEKDRFYASRGSVFFKSRDEDFESVSVEAFPKQDTLDGKDLGNLMRLPLGVNFKSGNRAFFIDTEAAGAVIRPTADPVKAMTEGNVL